jgi:dihydrofolate synthase/folylpolyglutamate synthase
MADTYQFLSQRIDYERVFSPTYTAREFRLARMYELMRCIEIPHIDVPVLHVAGTKGKGSTSAMAASILTAAGYRTGLFTSPHIDRIEERLSIDGQPCSSKQFADLLDRMIPAIQALDERYAACDPPEPGPTYFEIVTAMAFQYFAQQQVDLAVLEVGLGGRLDSTNVCSPLVCVITSISFDHMKQLGNTLEAIAREKAGIIKPGVPVVSGVVEPGPREVIRQACRQRGCRLVELGTDFDVNYFPPRNVTSGAAEAVFDFIDRSAERPSCYSRVAIKLLGRHQAVNAAVALAALAQLPSTSDRTWRIPESAVRTGLRQLHWPARIEVVAQRPAVIIDGAHNVASIRALIEVLNESFRVRRRILVFASTQEKEIAAMLRELLGQFDEVILTQYTDNPRAVPVDELAAIADQVSGRPIHVSPLPTQAWQTARDLASPDDLICVTGSFYIAAQIRREVLASARAGG